MPCRYVINKELRLVLSIGEGRVTIAEMKAHQDQLLRDANFDPNFNQLNDFTTAISVEASVGELQSFASRHVFSPSSRRAIVVPKPVLFGQARQFEAFHGERSQVRVFYDRDSALEWLGVPEDSGLC